jgi:hypothetical protein
VEDSTLGLRLGKTDNVESEVKELKPFAWLYLLGNERYPTKVRM